MNMILRNFALGQLQTICSGMGAELLSISTMDLVSLHILWLYDV